MAQYFFLSQRNFYVWSFKIQNIAVIIFNQNWCYGYNPKCAQHPNQGCEHHVLVTVHSSVWIRQQLLVFLWPFLVKLIFISKFLTSQSTSTLETCGPLTATIISKKVKNIIQDTVNFAHCGHWFVLGLKGGKKKSHAVRPGKQFSLLGRPSAAWKFLQQVIDTLFLGTALKFPLLTC